MRLTDPEAYRQRSRAPSPLGALTYAETDDPADAREKAAELFAPHRLEPLAGGPRFHATLRHARLNALSTYFVRYASDVIISSGPMSRFYLVLLPVAGHCELRYGDTWTDAVPGTVSVVNPFRPMEMRWRDGCTILAFKLDRGELERHLTSLLDQPPLHPVTFDPAPRPVSMCRPLIDMIELIYTDLDAGEAATVTSRAGEQAAETLFMSLLLRNMPNSVSGALGKPASRVAPYYVKRVEEFVRLNAAQPIAMADMIRVSGVSARALFKGFRNFRGMGPMKYLKTVRLERAHAELSDPGERRNVTDIATAWGFTHLGNFARDYQARFGQRPSETLRNRTP